MNRPNRLPILSSLLILAVAVAISAAATASFPGTVSAQAYPEFLVENVRANGTANQLTITWEPPQVAKDYPVGTGDDATTIARRTGVSHYVFWFEDRPGTNITPSSQGVDVSTTVTGLEPGRRYHFTFQTCFDGTEGYPGCYIQESGHRAAYTAPKAPLHISANVAGGNEVSLSWESGNLNLDRTPLDFYDHFNCEFREIEPGGGNRPTAFCWGPSSRRDKTYASILDPNTTYQFLVRHAGRSYTTGTSSGDTPNRVTGSYDASPWQTVTVGGKPKAPAEVRVTRISSTSARVDWEAVTQTTGGNALVGNVSYEVAWIWESFRDCTTPDGQTAQCFNGESGWGASTTGTSATVYNLDRNRDYKFSVLSRTEHRIGESSGWVGVSSDDLNTAQSNRQTVAQRYDANDNGIVDQAELVTAINDFYDYYDRITYDELQELLDIYNSQQSE